jgi:hypothetical protein
MSHSMYSTSPISRNLHMKTANIIPSPATVTSPPPFAKSESAAFAVAFTGAAEVVLDEFIPVLPVAEAVDEAFPATDVEAFVELEFVSAPPVPVAFGAAEVLEPPEVLEALVDV